VTDDDTDVVLALVELGGGGGQVVTVVKGRGELLLSVEGKVVVFVHDGVGVVDPKDPVPPVLLILNVESVTVLFREAVLLPGTTVLLVHDGVGVVDPDCPVPPVLLMLNVEAVTVLFDGAVLLPNVEVLLPLVAVEVKPDEVVVGTVLLLQCALEDTDDWDAVPLLVRGGGEVLLP